MSSTIGAHQVLDVPDQPDAARLVRRWLGGQVAGLPHDVIDDAMLLTSELVNNASRHGRPALQVTVRVRPPTLHVTVADREDALPVLPARNPYPTQTSGRGLILVQNLAAAWGVAPLRPGPGKTVWFTLQIG